MITGLMSWWDEDPDMLYDTVTSLRGTVDRLIALDGVYALFGSDMSRSPQVQHNALQKAAHDAQIPLEAHTVRRAFRDEMEKRTKLFSLAPDDGWLLWVDADEPVRYPDPELPTILEQTDHDVATLLMLMDPYNGNPWVTLHHEGQDRPTVIDGRNVYRLPRLYRAGLGIRIIDYHNDVRTRDNRNLWGREPVPPVHTNLVIDHRTDQRAPDRIARQKRYYHLRDSLRTEQGMCERCRTQPATTEVATPELDWMLVCMGCWDVVEWDKQKALA